MSPPTAARRPEENRAPTTVLGEAADYLALVATRLHYDEQPDLWRMGERGRARTLEDYGHHFRALAPLQRGIWRRHVTYCEALFDQRGFPRRWLEDAWRLMAVALRREMPSAVADPALAVLAGQGGDDGDDGLTRGASAGPPESRRDG